MTAVPIVPSAANSTVTADLSSLTADGFATVNVTVTLQDSAMGPLVGKSVTLNSSRSSQDLISPSTVGTDSSGNAVFTVTSTVAGSATFSAFDTTDSMAVTQIAPVTFTAGAPAAATSNVISSVATLVADGFATTTVTVTLNDAYNNVVGGQSVQLNSVRGSLDVISPSTATTDAFGVATFSVNSTSIGDAVFSADVTALSLTVTQMATVTYTPGPTSAVQSQIAASSSSIAADGAAISTITVTLKDANSNVVAGNTVTLASDRGVLDSISGSAVTDGSGVATFTVSSTAAGTSTYTATDTTESVMLMATASVTFTPGIPDASLSTVSQSLAYVLNNGSSTSTITVTLRDAFTNLVPGKTVSLTSSRGALDSLSAGSGVSNAAGVVTFTVSSVNEGTSTYAAADTTDTIALSSVTVRYFTPLTLSPSAATITVGGTYTFAYKGGVGPYFFTVAVGGGTVSSTGVYTAPLTASSAVVQVSDTGTGTSASSNVTINLGGVYSSVAMGVTHACGITSANKLKCWGANNIGQVGNGGTSNTSPPVAIDTLTSYNMVSSGFQYSCGITTANKLKCWGSNTNGVLGLGTFGGFQASPTAVDALQDYIFVAAGYMHVCAITTLNKLKCWGANSNYQLGNGLNTASNLPILIDATNNYQHVSPGTDSTCAVTTGGNMYCWGLNNTGQVGTGTTVTQTTPYLVGTGYSQAATGGQHACGLKGTSIFCWGGNYANQFGNGGTGFNQLPTLVSGSQSYQSVRAGQNYGCGIKIGGSLMCWGANSDGQVGTGNTTPQSLAVQIDTGNTYTAVSVGWDATCGITGGNIKCWGKNNAGQLGYYSSQANPVVIDNGTQYISISKSGKKHNCAIASGNILKCWGLNDKSQLGDSTNVNRNAPTFVGMGYAMVSSSGYMHSCAITTTGALQCWGSSGTSGVGTGIGADYNAPLTIDAGTTYKFVATAGSSSCGITTSDDLKCWGANGNGQLGTGDSSTHYTPFAVHSGTKYLTVAMSDSTTCGITTANQLRCWGYGGQYQLANGGISSFTPVIIDGVATFSKVSVGTTHVCAITTSNNLKCWGYSSVGQVGNGATGTIVTSPTIIDSSNLYRNVSAGTTHTCGILLSGTVKCWGDNSFGQLGDGTFVSKNTPVTVLGGTDNIGARAGDYTSVFLSATGELRGAGEGTWLGLGTFFNLSPGAVVP